MSAEGVTITFELRLKPETVAGFLAAIPKMLLETKEFDGFRSIRVVQHKDDPTRVLMVELWDSEEAYRKYIDWRTARGEMDGLAQLTNGTDINIWPRFVVQF
jgi:quinol monooxygenase YgiN